MEDMSKKVEQKPVEWRSLSILNCPNYLISNRGKIKNIKTGYESCGSDHGDYYRTTLIDSEKKKYKP